AAAPAIPIARGSMSIKLTVLNADDKIAEIRRLYFGTTKQTIQQDLARALQLLKSMNSEEERERAAVYMDGLSQMRSDWARQANARGNRQDGRHPGRNRNKGKGG